MTYQPKIPFSDVLAVLKSRQHRIQVFAAGLQIVMYTLSWNPAFPEIPEPEGYRANSRRIGNRTREPALVFRDLVRFFRFLRM